MGSPRNMQTDSVEALVLTEDSWARRVTELKREGMRVSTAMSEQGNRIVRILSPKEVRGGDTVPLGAVVLDLDWKIATRLRMVESARDLIAKAYLLDSLDPGLPTVLTAIIKGSGLYEHSIGEFFLLYGQFEGKYDTRDSQTKAKMEDLVNGDERYLKPYVAWGKQSLVPLPYAVRNILAHAAQNPNQIDAEGRELRISIDLLRSWVDTEQSCNT